MKVKDKLRRWTLDPGLWSMVDQGAVSAGNFITTILLARALVPSEYGIYALLYALMLFMYSLHAAAILYGLSLQGAVATDADLRPLAGRALMLTSWLGTFLGAAAGVVAILFHQIWLAPWILLAFLFWQLQEATRRALISRLRLRDVVWGDALSYLGQAAFIAYLFAVQRLTLTSAFFVMAATSAAAWLLQMSQLKLRFQHFCGAARLIPSFWGVGRWALLAKLAEAFMGQSLLWFLALRGTVEVAAFQSLLNLARFTNPVMFAVGSVILPSVAAGRSRPTERLHAVRRYSLLGALVLLPYLGVMLVFPTESLRLLYGAGSAYGALGQDLRVFVLGSAFAYTAHILTMYYFGLSRGDLVLRCELIAATTAVLAGFVLVTQAGVLGAAVAYDLTFAVAVAAFAWYLRHNAPAAPETAAAVRPAPVEDTYGH
ncbi:MAG TPA: hypothetical protein VNJ12_09090 [Candidatus Dormibacteraeota bacterium]|nr:hypothetical protein [Candidatus Dormibacteraeota bacterium]